MPIGMTLNYRLRLTDFDRFGHLHPAAVLDILQDLATVQAEDMGIGYNAMRDKGVFWAIVRMKYVVHQEPKHHSVVSVRTWPHSPSRFSFHRDWTMHDQDGNLLLSAASEWVVMDAKERSFVSVADIYEGSNDFSEDRAIEGRIRKLKPLPAHASCARTITPGRTDVDVNAHVNNARYATYAIDALDDAAGRPIVAFQADFRHEVRKDETVRVFTHQDETGACIGVRKDTDDIACSIKVDYA